MSQLCVCVHWSFSRFLVLSFFTYSLPIDTIHIILSISFLLFFIRFSQRYSVSSFSSYSHCHLSLLSSVSLKLTITTLLNLNCKRVRTHSPTTLLSSMTSSSSSPPSTTAVVSSANIETNTYSHKQYLSLCSIITAGLLNDDLGTDEQEIIEMVNLIIDVDERKVGFSGEKTIEYG